MKIERICEDTEEITALQLRESKLPFLLRFSPRKVKEADPEILSLHFTPTAPLSLQDILYKQRQETPLRRERETHTGRPSFSLHWTQLSAGAPWTVVGSTGSKQAGPHHLLTSTSAAT